jgi:hypothetical protein
MLKKNNILKMSYNKKKRLFFLLEVANLKKQFEPEKGC